MKNSHKCKERLNSKIKARVFFSLGSLFINHHFHLSSFIKREWFSILIEKGLIICVFIDFGTLAHYNLQSVKIILVHPKCKIILVSSSNCWFLYILLLVKILFFFFAFFGIISLFFLLFCAARGNSNQIFLWAIIRKIINMNKYT